MPIVKSTSNRGRPKAQYKPKLGGDPIIGLMRLADGRWRVSGPEKITFTEPDEKLAIARFHAIEAKRAGTDHVMAKFGNAVGEKPTAELIAKAVKPKYRIRIPRDWTKGVTVSRSFDTSEAWAWFREQIIERPKWVAQRVGIEQIAYLTDIEKPKPLPTFEELERTWETHFNSSPEQKHKCPKMFADFVKVTGVTAIDQITPEIVVAYRDAVYARKLSGKSQSNVFTRLRRYLAFFRDRALAVDAMNKALGYLTLLKPNETTVTLDPKPIETDDWHKLMAKAKGDDRAMILLMLNCAMYVAEVVNVDWDEIRNGCLVTHRAKTGKCVRVAVLWPETLEALAAVKRRGPHVFYSYAGERLGIKGAERRFRFLRDAAKVNVTSSMLRDGAYTAAVEANVTSNLCQLLVGHRSGLQDNYVKRRPTMVAPACEAIRAHYINAGRAV